ncbi:piggyBac transposable element-derived protein 4-like, partial [Aphis craccivora]
EPKKSQTHNIWLNDSPDLDPIVFKENTGLKIYPNGDKPIDFFDLLVTDDFYDFVLEETNNYAAELYLTRSSNKSRISKWIELTKNELKAFFGLVFHTGTIKMPRMADYWKTDKLFNLNCFREVMSRNRYMLIMRALHFSRNPERGAGGSKPSRLYKIDTVVEYFNNRMLEVYQPSKQLSLDESMVLWRGRLVFRQYIKNKRHKYGIKLYMLTEPNGLVLNILIYSGQGTDSTPEQSHTEHVVYRLMENHLDKGHSLFMDNYYNSSSLAHTLLQRKTYCTGTLRNNRKNNPKEVISKKLKTGETACKYTKDGVCIVKWKDKREVLAISSEFKNEMVEAQNKYGQSKLKPLPISEYNKFMSGIDRQDQMMSYYPCERKTLRWYKKIAIHFLQIALLNSFLLYCKNVKKISYYDFRISVINSLISSNKDTISDTIRLPCSLLPQRHLPIKVDKNRKNRYIRKRCRICVTKGKRTETIYYCNKCEDQPGLCLELCFEEYHNK